ncbi:hypothetical protein M407DRAFT_242650 [Tulasnella calospora MUT 4182]|uniref:Uncharacterized protein n=1 Tax=Tulasnella calospora MUT 4182 TaxID=1051891 RepID=A0A0C3M6L3_9AGAM|nr:hypothetical protein M407DRAFT_242650 [Tulasnella calospora MUT 4182]
MTAKYFEAFSENGDIYGTVRATDTYNVTSRHGVVSLVNLANATATSVSPRSPGPQGPSGGPFGGPFGGPPGPAPPGRFRC